MSKVNFANSINIKLIYKDYYGGKEVKGNVCCPFHDDTNASLALYTKNNKYKCFGCGSYGGPIDFVLNLKYNNDKGKFMDVVNELCNNYGYVPDSSSDTVSRTIIRDAEAYEKKVQYTKDIKVFSDIAHHYIPSKNNYFAQRGIPESIQQQYCLGYMDPRIETKSGIDFTNVIKAGIVDTEGKINYSGRWIIPIKDAYGNHIAWAGRSTDAEQPRYINSPNSDYFHKGKILWNYDVAKRYDTIYVVEGFMDALSLITAGIPNVVALMSCEMTDEQYRLLYGKDLILGLDNDVAGNRATCKMILEHRERNFNVLDFGTKKEKDLNEILINSGKDEVIKVTQTCVKSGVEWCLRKTAFYTDLTDIANQEKLWKTLSKLIGAREEAYQNAYPLNLNYSPIMFNKYWEIFDQLITNNKK